MSRIVTYTANSNLIESVCAPKIHPSAQDWDVEVIHDKNRGTVIASARLLYSFFLKTHTDSITHPGSRRSHPDHFSVVTNIRLPEIRLVGWYLHQLCQGLDKVTSHIYLFLIFLRFPTCRNKYCGSVNTTIF